METTWPQAEYLIVISVIQDISKISFYQMFLEDSEEFADKMEPISYGPGQDVSL